MYSFIQEVNKESPLKFEPNSEQQKQGYFKWLKEVLVKNHQQNLIDRGSHSIESQPAQYPWALA